MTKSVWYIVFGAVAIGVLSAQRSCAKEPVLALPSAVDGWQRNQVETCLKPVPVELQLWRGTAGAHSVCRASYDGAPPMKLTIYDMPNEFASAFDAAQKWQPQSGKMSFFQGRYFGVVESPGADPFTLQRFVLAVEATLPPGNEWHH